MKDSEAVKKNPNELWDLFEAQIKTNLNFRAHRLKLMVCRQKYGETIYDFVTRAQTIERKNVSLKKSLNH